MTTAAVFLVKDEADVIEGTIRHIAGEVDFVIVADNRSKDGTREILDQLASELPVTVQDQPEVGYYQSRFMSALAAQAAEMGASWVLPADADEIWIAPGGRIADVLAGLGSTHIAKAALFNHLRTRDDEPDVDPFVSMVWRQRDAARLPKVAFRYQDGAVIHQGNHGVTLPNPGLQLDVLEIRHFPVRSAKQLMSKARNGAAAYKATDLDPDMGLHWRSWGAILERHGPKAITDIYNEHWFYRSPVDSGLVRDPAPYRRWEEKGNKGDTGDQGLGREQGQEPSHRRVHPDDRARPGGREHGPPPGR